MGEFGMYGSVTVGIQRAIEECSAKIIKVTKMQMYYRGFSWRLNEEGLKELSVRLVLKEIRPEQVQEAINALGEPQPIVVENKECKWTT